MRKPTMNAEELRDAVLALLRKAPGSRFSGELPTSTGPIIDVPHAHPRDALGRNWDIARAEHVHGVASLRLAIDRIREAYDLANPEDAPTNR